MEIILIKDVENLGYKDQIVDVRPGYANNKLIPQGYAITATSSAKKVHAENLKQRAHKEAKFIADAEALAASISANALTIKAKASEKGKIFGAITNAQIAEELEAKGVQVDRKAVTVAPVKELGSYEATVRVYKDIKAIVKFDVVAEE